MVNNTCCPITIAPISFLEAPKEGMEVKTTQISESQELRPTQVFHIPLSWIIANESIGTLYLPHIL